MQWNEWSSEVLPQLTNKRFETFGSFLINGQDDPILKIAIIFWRMRDCLPGLSLLVSYANHLKSKKVLEVNHGKHGLAIITIVDGVYTEKFTHRCVNRRKRPFSEGLYLINIFNDYYKMNHSDICTGLTRKN